LINTNTTLVGNGTLTLISNASPNGLSSDNDLSTSLAKRPSDGRVYYIDDQGATAAGRLRIFDPRQGPGNGAFSTASGTLSVSDGGNTYSFNDFPARLEFNTPTGELYAAAGYRPIDGQPTLSGFYRINLSVNGNSVTSVSEIQLRVGSNDLEISNNGDLAFVPSGTNAGRLFITSGNRLYVSSAALASGEAGPIAMTEITLNPADFGGSVPPIPNVSFDATTDTILLTTLSGSDARMYRVAYNPTTFAVTSVTPLTNGNYAGRSIVDTTSGHTN
jgi:hypothetical protein